MMMLMLLLMMMVMMMIIIKWALVVVLSSSHKSADANVNVKEWAVDKWWNICWYHAGTYAGSPRSKIRIIQELVLR